MSKGNENPAQKRVEIAQGTNLNRGSRIAELEEALRGFAQFRYNCITRFPEVKYHKKGSTWKRMDDYELNSIVRRLQAKGVKFASKTRVGDLLDSDFSKKVNPIQEYFQKLPPNNGGYIEMLTDTVELASDPASANWKRQIFKTSFKKWTVGAVANVFIEDKCANQLCFILAGPQGTFKSTWIRHLCPVALIEYYIEGGLDPDNKDSMLATATNFIFNLDDYFAGISSRKINEFKGLLTKNMIKVRRSYARYAEELPKICSFIASSNEAQFLHDPTGNRRFLPFEVKSIDISKAQSIDMDKVWAEAYQLFKEGFVYWLEKEDQDKLQEYNERFEVQSNEFEVLVTYMRPPAKNETADAHLTNAEILAHLHSEVSIRLSTKKLGEALRKAGFVRRQKRRNKIRTWGYDIIYADQADIYTGRQPDVPRGSSKT